MTSSGKFRWGNTMQLPSETLVKEFIISPNSLSFRNIALHKCYLFVSFIKTLVMSAAVPLWRFLMLLIYQDIILFQLLQMLYFLEKNMYFRKIAYLEYVAFSLRRRITTLQDYNISQNKFPQNYYHP